MSRKTFLARLANWTLLITAFGFMQSAQAQAPTPRKRPAQKPSPAATPAAAAAEQPKYKGIWEPVSYSEDLQLLDVFFVNADVGWVAGGTNAVHGGIILNTRDGGSSWTVQYGDPGSSEYAVRDLRFIDETTGWAVQRTSSDAKLFHTRDGENWILAGTMAEHYEDYMFTSETTGVFLGPQGAVFITQDGGRKWQQVFQCAAKVQVEGLWRNVGCHWKRLQFLTPSTGYAVAYSYDAKGIFLARTDDGGATWSLTYSEAPGYAEDIFFLDESTGYVRVGHESTGQLYKTEDGGQTWTGMAASPGRRILFADPEVGWALLYNKVSFTTNAGLRWNSREYRFPATTSALSLPRRDRAYVVGDHGMIFRYRVVPIAEEVAKAIPAPAMPVFDSPLDDQVAQLETQVEALEEEVKKEVGEQGASGGGQAGGEAAAQTSGSSLVDACCQEQVQKIEATAEAVASEVPKFTGKYRSLNLIFAGLGLVGQLFGQAQGLKDSLSTLRQARDPAALSAALNELSGQVTGLVQSTKSAFQSPGQVQEQPQE